MKIHPRIRPLGPSVFLSIVFALPMCGYSSTITQTVSNVDWNSAMWGAGPDAPTSGNDYVTAIGGNDIVRIGAAGTSSIFGGDSLTGIAGTRILSKLQDGQTGTINGDLTLAGGRLSFAPNGAGNNSILDFVNLAVTANSQIDVGASTLVSTVDATLTGSGDILFLLENAPTAALYDQYITFTDISGYTGALTVTDEFGLEFGVSHLFANTLTLQDADSFLIVNAGQTLSFTNGGLVDANGTVAPGTYSGATLDALGANYLNNGGTVVVIPEPSSIALTLAGMVLLFARRRVR